MIARVGIPQAYVNQTSRRITAQKLKIYNWICHTISSSKNGSTIATEQRVFTVLHEGHLNKGISLWIPFPFVLKSRGSTWKPGTNMQIILIWSARWIPLYILLMTFYFEFGFVFGLYIISLKQLTIYIMSTKHGHFCVMCNMFNCYLWHVFAIWSLINEYSSMVRSVNIENFIHNFFLLLKLLTTWAVLCKSSTQLSYDNVGELCAWFTQHNSSCKQVACDSFRQKLCFV